MPSLEQIVRPFVVLDTTPPRIPLPTTTGATSATSQGNVIINIGLGGKGKTISTSYSVSASFYQDKIYEELGGIFDMEKQAFAGPDVPFP